MLCTSILWGQPFRLFCGEPRHDKWQYGMGTKTELLLNLSFTALQSNGINYFLFSRRGGAYANTCSRCKGRPAGGILMMKAAIWNYSAFPALQAHAWHHRRSFRNPVQYMVLYRSSQWHYLATYLTGGSYSCGNAIFIVEAWHTKCCKIEISWSNIAGAGGGIAEAASLKPQNHATQSAYAFWRHFLLNWSRESRTKEKMAYRVESCEHEEEMMEDPLDPLPGIMKRRREWQNGKSCGGNQGTWCLICSSGDATEGLIID